MSRRAQLSEEEEEQAREVARAANEQAEPRARRKGAPEERESDFTEAADLSGKHTPRKGWTYVLPINGTDWRMAPLDNGGYNAFTKALQDAENEKNKLQRSIARLAAQKAVLEESFAEAVGAEAAGEVPTESSEGIEAQIEAVEAEVDTAQLSQAKAAGKPLEAMYAIVEFCLRDWVRSDGVGINAATRAALDSSRVNQLATAAVERKVAGDNSARFR